MRNNNTDRGETMNKLITIIQGKKQTTFDNEDDAREYIDDNKGQDDVVNKEYNKKVFGVRYINYTIAFSQERQDARLDSEAQDKVFEYLRDTFDERVMILEKDWFGNATVKQLRTKAKEMYIILPKKALKAEIVGIISHEHLTRENIATVNNTDRNTTIPTGDEKQ